MRMLLLKTWRDMKARKGQFGALILLVTLGIAIYAAFVGAALDLEASAARSNEEFRLADFETRVVAAPTALADDIAAIEGVRAVQGRLVVDTGLQLGDDEISARVIGIPADGHPVVDDVQELEGVYLDPDVPDGVLLHNAFAEARDVAVGEVLDLRAEGATAELEVVGIGTSAEYFFLRRTKEEIPDTSENTVVWAAQERVEELFGMEGSYNSFAVLVEADADREAVIEDVEAALDDFYVLSTTVVEDQPSNFGIQEEIQQNQTMAGLMPFLILGVSAMALGIALARLVQSQRGEIGLSKALGYTDRQILLQYLGFSLIIAIVGSLLGVALGQAMAYGIGFSYRSFLNLPLLESRFHPELVGGAVALSVLVCLLAGIFPAARSARMKPAEAMHSDPNLSQTKGRIPVVERWFGWALPKAVVFRLPIRNVFRSRRRSVYTIIGTVFALILIVSTWAMNDSIDFLLDFQFQDIDVWDVAVSFSDNLAVEEVREAADVEGVTALDTALVVPVTLRFEDEQRDLALTAADPQASFHGFTVAEGEDVAETLRSGGLVLPENMADSLGVELGDNVEVESPYLDEVLTLEVATLSEELFGSPLFVGEDVGRRLVASEEPVANVAYLFTEDVSTDRLEEDLYASAGVANVVVKESLVGMLDSLMGFVRFFVGLLFVFAFSVAFVVIYNTFTTNVIERTREIATMQTIGEDRRHLAWMITAENLLLALVSVPIGVYLGLLAAEAMFEQMSTEAYTLPTYISSDSYWLIAVSVLAILLVSEIPPILRIFRMDLAAATKVME